MAYRFIALLLGFLWFPASSHCLLEAAEWLEADPACESPASHGDRDASHDACATCQFESNTLYSIKSKNCLKTGILTQPATQVSLMPSSPDKPAHPPPRPPLSVCPQSQAFQDLGLLFSGPPRAPEHRS